MRVEFTDRALAQIERIGNYIAADSPAAAARVVRRIQSVADQLAAHPWSGHKTSRPGNRVIFASPYPYLIAYTVRGDIVTILRVRHAARRPLDH
ncbi:MAG TPA: type II toxin-antitoxin system RelE/ParE family toxin [Beijerinckiaceae bacterium]|jgi:addiction module RelE/StbE family toxin